MFKFIRRLILLIILAAIAIKGYQVHRDVKQVMTYQNLVREVLDEQDTAANEELVLAMIYTETKGRNNDLMQSSESATGEINSITDNKESVRQGIQTLSDNLELASEKRWMSGRQFRPTILVRLISTMLRKMAARIRSSLQKNTQKKWLLRVLAM